MLIGKKIWWLYTSVRPQACDGHKIFIFSIQENFDLQKMSILEKEFFKSEIRIGRMKTNCLGRFFSISNCYYILM